MQGLGERIVVNLDVPQTVINFGGPGVARHDPDFFAAYVVNHIYGGGSMTSRLYHEVREKRGLAYWHPHQPDLDGPRQHRERRHRDALRPRRPRRSRSSTQETKRMADEGPTQEELDKAKAYLKGSYALAFDTSGKIAGQLVQIQLDKLGIDYPERRSAMIDAVTLADAKRVAKRLLDTKSLTVVVGRAQGLNKTN